LGLIAQLVIGPQYTRRVHCSGSVPSGFKHLANARYRLFEVLHAGGERDAHVSLGAKSRPGHQCDTNFLEQQISRIDIVIEVVAGIDKSLDVGEALKGAMRFDALDIANRIELSDQVIMALLELFNHGAYRRMITV
jgi:hypothetical protein